MGDIEKFFNENFFKKVTPSEKILKQESDVFNGSPEGDYEPSYPQELTPFKVRQFSSIRKSQK